MSNLLIMGMMHASGGGNVGPPPSSVTELFAAGGGGYSSLINSQFCKTQWARNVPIVAISGSPSGILVYDFSTGEGVLRPLNTGVVTYQPNGIAISPDGDYIFAVEAFNTTTFDMLKWDGTKYVLLQKVNWPSGISYCAGIDYNPVNNVVVFGHWNAITIYSHTGDNVTLLRKFVDDGSVGIGQTENIAWDPLGELLAIGGRSDIQVKYIDSAGNVNHRFITSTANWGCGWSDTGDYVFMAGQIISSGLYGFKKSGSGASATFSSIAGFTVAGQQPHKTFGFIHNGIEYIMSPYGSSYRKYKKVGDVFTDESATAIPGMTISGQAGCYQSKRTYSNGKQYIASTRSSAPYLQVWRID